MSGKQVLRQWFSYRRKNRARPLIGDKRPPSPLGDIQLDRWLPEYTSELINVLNVLALLVELEPKQADLLKRICVGPLIPASKLTARVQPPWLTARVGVPDLRAKSMPRAYLPVMAIWSPFRNKPRFRPRHHSNLTAARPRLSPPEARKIMHFQKPLQFQDHG